MLQASLELDSFQADRTWKEHIHELAIGSSGRHLLDLGVGCAEAVVDPGEHVVPREVVGRHRRAVHVHRHFGKKKFSFQSIVFRLYFNFHRSLSIFKNSVEIA